MNNLIVLRLLGLVSLFILLTLSAGTAQAQAPTWQWATKAGARTGGSIAVDAAGNIYETGELTGTATFGATTLTSAGNGDLFVAKLNSSGAYQWALSVGSSRGEHGTGIALDTGGNIYVTGIFNSTTLSFGSVTITNHSSNTDFFVAKLTAAGVWAWAVSAGASDHDLSAALALDNSGNVYITGKLVGQVVFGNTTLNGLGGADVFVAKLNSAGAWQWAVSAGGLGDDYGEALALNDSGNVYITGYFHSPTATFGSTTFTNSSSGGFFDTDVFVAKLTSAGAWQWAARTTGAGYEVSTGLAVDGNDNLYLAGYFESPTAAFGTIALTNNGAYDAFVAKLDINGMWQWAHNMGGHTYDGSNGVAVDSSGNVYVSGSFEGNPVSFGATILQSVGANDLFVAKLNPAGTWQWATSAGGSGRDGGVGVVDPIGNVYVTGGFQGLVAV